MLTDTNVHTDKYVKGHVVSFFEVIFNHRYVVIVLTQCVQTFGKFV